MKLAIHDYYDGDIDWAMESIVDDVQRLLDRPEQLAQLAKSA